jgi:hypothetical protein
MLLYSMSFGVLVNKNTGIKGFCYIKVKISVSDFKRLKDNKKGIELAFNPFVYFVNVTYSFFWRFSWLPF